MIRISKIRDRLLSRHTYKDIVVIAKKRNQLNFIKECMEKVGVPCTIINRSDYGFDADSIKFLTMYSIKGL